MRVLVVTDLYPPVAFGGYESETAALVEGLRERHEVLVLTSDRDRTAVPAVPHVRRELPYVGSRRREALRAPVVAARAAAAARGVRDEFRPDVVYVANSVAIPQAAPLAAAETGLPVVYRLSELFMAESLYTGDRYLRNLAGTQSGLRAPWAAVMRAANRHRSLRLEPTARSRAALSWASNALRSRVRLAPWIEPVLERTIHPASTQEEAFANVRRVPVPDSSVLFLGRMTTAKGIEIAFEAIAALRHANAMDARLELVGTATPEMRARLERLADRLGIAGAIHFHGQLATETLADLLARVGALVLPTVEWDVFPLVLIEAGLARVPIVASRIGGVPEAVVDGQHALLFEPGDVEGCADALASILRDPAQAENRAERAFERMRELSVARYREQSERFIAAALEALS